MKSGKTFKKSKFINKINEIKNTRYAASKASTFLGGLLEGTHRKGLNYKHEAKFPHAEKSAFQIVDELSVDLDKEQSLISREDNASELNSKINFRKKCEEVQEQLNREQERRSHLANEINKLKMDFKMQLNNNQIRLQS